MSRTEFEKRLYISYLDETTVYSFNEVIYHAVVSMTVNKEIYINEIEKGWADIRKRFGVQDGVCLHFTDIKALLNPKYFDRPIEVRNVAMESLFCLNGSVLYDRLYDFYNSICELLQRCNFTVQVTGKRYRKTPMLTNKKVKEFSNGYWYPLFRDHLDSMTYFLMKIAYDEYISEVQTKANAKYHNKTVKLRYDGDFDLSVRNDFRNAFSHSISNGTKRFNADAFKDIFDEVRFIDKSEIGFCTVCSNSCAPKLINHAGNEIVDFIAVYVARSIAYQQMKADYIELENKNEEEVEDFLKNGLSITINDKDPIYPLNAISPKIFEEV